MTEPKHMTAMARETAEVPAAAERLLKQNRNISAAAECIRSAKPRLVVTCGRGSSGHVGTYLRYLFEARLGLLDSAAAPSVMTAYRSRPDMRDTLFVLVSQSGRSPDLVVATRAARARGALTLAIVNDAQSPAADAAELVMPIEAGPEKAVAATKSVTLSMIAGAQLVATLAQDDDLIAALGRLPARLQNVLACDWSVWGKSLEGAAGAFIAGRGYGLASARELALKTMEVLRIPALGYSAAELRHGPRAAITASTPVLVLRQNDEAATGIDELIRDLREDGQSVFSAGGTSGTLPWIGDDHPICDPVAMLLPAYLAIESEARRRGFDVDNPPHLRKVTCTL